MYLNKVPTYLNVLLCFGARTLTGMAGLIPSTPAPNLTLHCYMSFKKPTGVDRCKFIIAPFLCQISGPHAAPQNAKLSANINSQI